jgi:hypothetical protein
METLQLEILDQLTSILLHPPQQIQATMLIPQ